MKKKSKLSFKMPRAKMKLKPNLENYEKTYKNFSWKTAEKEIEFFDKKNKRLNAAYNAIDRHCKTEKKDKIALYWEGGNGEEKRFTFSELMQLSNKFANVLKKYKIKRGERVFIFLPRIPELYYCFLGILKTGAIGGTMFSAFGPNALLDRLKNSEAKALVTTTELKKRLKTIRKDLPDLKYIFCVDKPRKEKGVVDLQKEMASASDKFKVKAMKKGDFAFMLYTSGTTGKPKGVVHCHGAIIQQHITAKYVLDLHEDDIYWCTADPGWVTGIAYDILGNWSNGVSSVVFEGRFDPDYWYKIIEKYKVSIWYTAPTAIRMLMKAGKDIPKKYNLNCLRYMNSVGEPLNPEAIKWGEEVLNLQFHDNWWQTETGSMMIANYFSMPIRRGSMGKPFPGIKAGIVDDNGVELGIGKEGNLAIRPGWPSMMKRIWKNRKKYNSYFKNNWYISGDVALKDKDNYFWFIGRADDVIKTSGERVGPFEVESALMEHPAVVEAGVIGKPDPLRGEIIKAFITLSKKYQPSEKLKTEIQEFIKKRFAGHAYPREIEFVAGLPKTRSGKIMRRLLKAKELGLPIGDTSTLEEY